MAPVVEIVILGSQKSGKTALLSRFSSGSFSDTYLPTLRDLYRKTIKVDGKEFELELCDTGNDLSEASMRDLDISNGTAFVVTYAVDSRASFMEAFKLLDLIRIIKEPTTVPVIIAATKCDLSPDSWQVQHNEGEALAKSWNCRFLETSAKTDHNVEPLFVDLVRQLTDKKSKKKKEKGHKGDCTIL